MGTFTQRSKVRHIREEFDPWTDRKAIERRKLERPVVGLEKSADESIAFKAAESVALPGYSLPLRNGSLLSFAPPETKP
jgi:hypothetical protein